MSNFFVTRNVSDYPRIPLRGSLDLTYRCNNKCRHCWISIPRDSSQKNRELTTDEIIRIVDEARKLGLRRWYISGGEPLLRTDFVEILEYTTRGQSPYSLNTNGTLITQRIARAMRRKGNKMIALYGATSDVHDHITRNPGSFDAMMKGLSYLKEAGAGFTVQVIPMKDNFYQFAQMVDRAKSLSPHWRIGATWLYLSARGERQRNTEIRRQRLAPPQVIDLDHPDVSCEDLREIGGNSGHVIRREDHPLFAGCATDRREFHIDPYGGMTFCCFVQDPALRYDLKQGSVEEGWETFIPSLADRIRGSEEYAQNCGSCDLRADCRWCPAYAYLEHRQHSAPIKYLCAVAEEKRSYKECWRKDHRRYFRIAGITIQVDADVPMGEDTFESKLKPFQVDGAGEDTIRIRHHVSLPDEPLDDSWKELYRKPPWAIYRKENAWAYSMFSTPQGEMRICRLALFNNDLTVAHIYSPNEEPFRKGGLGSLSLLVSDQILLARILASRQGCYLHSAGVIMNGNGLLFAGHSEAGKSTMVTLLREHSEILCDDRIIVRRWPEGFKIHGTWSHGDVPDVSANSAPLRALLFLEKGEENRLCPMEDRGEITRRLLAFLIKPFVTHDWWEKTLTLVEQMVREVPCYTITFDKSGDVVEVLKDFLATPRHGITRTGSCSG